MKGNASTMGCTRKAAEPGQPLEKKGASGAMGRRRSRRRCRRRLRRLGRRRCRRRLRRLLRRPLRRRSRRRVRRKCQCIESHRTRGVLRRTDESYEGAVSPPRRLFVGAAEKRPQTSSARLMLPGGPCTQSDEDLNHLMTIGSDRRCRRPKRSSLPCCCRART